MRDCRQLPTMLCGCAALAAPTAAQAGDSSVTVAPFVWGPSMHGTMTEGPVVIPLNANVGDLAGGVKGGGMLHVEASNDRLHGSVQAIYVDFHDRSFAPVFGANVKSSLFTIEALGGPRLRRGRFELSPMAGLRHTRIVGRFDAAGLGRLTAGRSWQEGLAGLEGSYRATDRLTLRARASVAFAGPKGQDSSDLIVAGTWRINRTLSLAAGYRWARDKVVPSSDSAFGLDLRAKGPVAGLLVKLK